MKGLNATEHGTTLGTGELQELLHQRYGDDAQRGLGSSAVVGDAIQGGGVETPSATVIS